MKSWWNPINNPIALTRSQPVQKRTVRASAYDSTCRECGYVVCGCASQTDVKRQGDNAHPAPTGHPEAQHETRTVGGVVWERINYVAGCGKCVARSAGAMVTADWYAAKWGIGCPTWLCTPCLDTEAANEVEDSWRDRARAMGWRDTDLIARFRDCPLCDAVVRQAWEREGKTWRCNTCMRAEVERTDGERGSQ